MPASGDMQAAGLPIDLSQIPWSFVMAFASLGLIFWLFRRRADLFDDFGFTGREVALLALGSIAGWAVNIPLRVYGGTYLAVNVGGTLVPLMLIAWWVRRGKLRLLPAAVGTALVAVTAWKIVEFRPDTGIIARYPHFFLPVVVALGFALLVSLRKPITGVPVAYASGTLGALIGADLMHVADIRRHFQDAPENTIISIGGAGVFDMVFLAGTSAMALHLAIAIAFARAADPKAAATEYPGTPLTLRDSRRVHATFARLEHPNPLERALECLALSNIALREGDHGRSVRMSWLAVDSLVHHETVARWLAQAETPASLRADVEALRARNVEARGREATLREAGEANHAAKVLVAALAPVAGLRHSLEGVA